MLTRRELLKVSGAVALAGCGGDSLLASSDRVAAAGGGLRTLNEDASVFPLGVMAGDSTEDSCILWTRTLVSSLRVQVWNATEVLVVDAAVNAVDGFVHVDVMGLQPGHAYRYCFVAGENTRSAWGRFRTAPALESRPLITFAGTSCTEQRKAPFAALANAASKSEIQFFVHNGDHVYCDGAKSKADFRKVYAHTYGFSGMRALHQAFSFYGTWDDHEIDNNWDPETTEPSLIEAGRDAYFEHTPIRRSIVDDKRVWRSFQFGRTAEMFMLDLRSERLPSAREQYISRAQLDWLKQGLATSKAQFKFIVNPVPIASFSVLWNGRLFDRWEGYPAQRDELLSFIVGERLRGVYFLSGDFHAGFTGRVDKRGPYSALREIVWGPGGNSPNAGWPLLKAASQWDFVTPKCNYAVLDANPATDALGVRYYGESGELLFQTTYANQ